MGMIVSKLKSLILCCDCKFKSSCCDDSLMTIEYEKSNEKQNTETDIECFKFSIHRKTYNKDILPNNIDG